MLISVVICQMPVSKSCERAFNKERNFHCTTVAADIHTRARPPTGRRTTSIRRQGVLDNKHLVRHCGVAPEIVAAQAAGRARETRTKLCAAAKSEPELPMY